MNFEQHLGIDAVPRHELVAEKGSKEPHGASRPATALEMAGELLARVEVGVVVAKLAAVRTLGGEAIDERIELLITALLAPADGCKLRCVWLLGIVGYRASASATAEFASHPSGAER